MGHLIQWGTLFDLIQKSILVLLGVFFVRAKGDEIGRTALRQTANDLRDQISDRDRVSISLREQINTLTGRVINIEAEVTRKEAQVEALLEENISLKQMVRQLKK